MTLQPGTIIDGKYRIVRELGRGGMGSVYEGDNERIHRRVAIKVLHASVSGKADVVQRFEREAQAAGRIGSEHIVEVLDLGNLWSGERFMVMEFLDGESLGQRIKKRKRLTPHELAPILHGLLEGLAGAHEAGIVHRDLKPDNVYLVNTKTQRDFVKILDFGVSKFSAIDNSDMNETKAGSIMGTPYYMSPEQARGGQIDARSDLYSVGVVMYQAITGRLPFQAQTFNELVFKIALEMPDPAERLVPNLDPMFAQIIARAMQRETHMRFQSAREFQATIAQWMMANPGGPDPNAHRIPTMTPGMGFDPRMTGQNMLTGPGGISYPPGYDPRLAQSGLGQSGFAPPGMPLGAMNPGTMPPGFDPRMSQQGMPLAMSQAGQLGMSQAGPLGMSQPGQLGMSQPGQLGMSQPGQLGMSQAAFGMSQGSLTMTPPAPKTSGLMVAVGLFGTLLIAVSAALVYTLVLDKPSVASTNQAASAQAVAAPTPTPTPTPTPAPTPTPTSTVEPIAEATTADPPTTTTPTHTQPVATPPPTSTAGQTASRTTPTNTSTGGSTKKTSPTPTSTSTGGRKMGSEL